AAAHHLGDRGERDLLAVRGSASSVPGDDVGTSIEHLAQLPGEATLADAGDAGHRDQAASPVADDSVPEVDELAELAVAADERAAVAPGPAAPPGLARRRDAECLEGRGSPLQFERAYRLVVRRVMGEVAGRAVTRDAGRRRVVLEA